MGKALKGVPKRSNTKFDGIVLEEITPKGIVAARINPETGFRDEDGEILEYFFQENVPPEAGSNFGEMESFLQEHTLPEDSDSSERSDSERSDSERSDSEESGSESTFKFLDFIKWN